nr:probable salivary secreted peptide [Megalopta genalis]
MSAQKVIACLAIVLVAVIEADCWPTAAAPDPSPENEIYANNYSVESQNCTIGYGDPGDRLVLLETITVKGSGTQVRNVTKLFNRRQWEMITMIQAVDQKPKDNASCAMLINSGPGFVSVTFKFKSQKGLGINYYLEIYALPAK